MAVELKNCTLCAQHKIQRSAVVIAGQHQLCEECAELKRISTRKCCEQCGRRRISLQSPDKICRSCEEDNARRVECCKCHESVHPDNTVQVKGGYLCVKCL